MGGAIFTPGEVKTSRWGEVLNECARQIRRSRGPVRSKWVSAQAESIQIHAAPRQADGPGRCRGLGFPSKSPQGAVGRGRGPNGHAVELRQKPWGAGRDTGRTAQVPGQANASGHRVTPARTSLGMGLLTPERPVDGIVDSGCQRITYSLATCCTRR